MRKLNPDELIQLAAATGWTIAPERAGQLADIYNGIVADSQALESLELTVPPAPVYESGDGTRS